ncbi:MAG: hypothetical protein HYU67_09100 [Flavobacteriia bacterium]|nr:hypothetical protein [Flavobacteriia bacterium]
MKKLFFLVCCITFNILNAQSDAYPDLLLNVAGGEGKDAGNDRDGNIYIVGGAVNIFNTAGNWSL